MFPILDFLTGPDDPHGIVRSLAEALAPGSAVAVSHSTGEEVGSENGLAAQKLSQGVTDRPAGPVAHRLERDEECQGDLFRRQATEGAQ
jgi:hypothetical protein